MNPTDIHTDFLTLFFKTKDVSTKKILQQANLLYLLQD